MRVFRARPSVLDYLCVDCAACIASCPSGAIYVEGTAHALAPAPDVTLILPPPVLVQFGTDFPPRRIVAELLALGYADVRVTSGWELALRAAVREYAENEAPLKPVISPVCSAVVNLIETRFPSLIPHVAPFLSPMEAARDALADRKLAFAVTCPCQRTALLNSAGTNAPDIVLPGAVRSALLPRLHAAGAPGAPRPPAGAESPSRHDASAPVPGILRVSGATHVVNVLEQIEDEQAGDLPAIIEAYMCLEAGFGTPLLREDPYLTRHRWAAARMEPDAEARAIRRTQPYAQRPGLRLDADMSKAIQKLARIDKLARGLPGANCGLCGAPTCVALAEDIVLGRAGPDACVRLRSQLPPWADQPAPDDEDSDEVPSPS